MIGAVFFQLSGNSDVSGAKVQSSVAQRGFREPSVVNVPSRD